MSPEYKGLVFTIGMPAMFGELVLMLWLLIRGILGKPGCVGNKNNVAPLVDGFKTRGLCGEYAEPTFPYVHFSVRHPKA